VLSRKKNLSGGNGYGEKLKPTEAVFSNNPAGGSIEDINEHVFFRMTGEIAGEYFYKMLFFTCSGLYEPFCHVKPMRPFAAIQPNPVTGTIGTVLIQPALIFRYASLNLSKA